MPDLIEMTRLCSVCYNMCRDMCSVAGATRREADCPHFRANFVYSIMQEYKPLTPEIVDYFYRCSLCKSCREACETGQDTGEVLFSARKDLDHDLLPETLKKVKAQISSGRPYGVETDSVKALIAEMSEPNEKRPLFILGPKMRAGSKDSDCQVRTVGSLMKKLDTEFAVIPDEPATGQIPYFLGFTSEGRKLALEFKERLTSVQAKQVVVFSADDLRMLTVGFPGMGIDLGGLEVLSLPEFLLKIMEEQQPELKDSGRINVAYHDPCGLGRETRVFEAPRKIISMLPGIKLVELAFKKDQAPCCGYGVGLSFSHPEITRVMARRIFTLTEDANADILVTGCPTCRDTILENIDADQGPIEILDLTLFLDRMIP